MDQDQKFKDIIDSIVRTLTAIAERQSRTLFAIYVYGSVSTEFYSNTSDIDIAVLFQEPLSPEEYYTIYEIVSKELNTDVDLIDLHNVNVVMQAIVLSSGKRVYENNAFYIPIEQYEDSVYRRYITLNEDRKPILDQIKETGTIYG